MTEIELCNRLLKYVGGSLTLQIFLGYNATRHYNLNVIAHALQHVLRYIFCQVTIVLGYLQRVTKCHHQFICKNNSSHF